MYSRAALQGLYTNRVSDISAQLITDASNAKILFVSDTIVDICNNIITTNRDTSYNCLYYVPLCDYFYECVDQLIDGVKSNFDVSMSVITFQRDISYGGDVSSVGFRTVSIHTKYDYTTDVSTNLYVNIPVTTYDSSGNVTSAAPVITLGGTLDEETGDISGGTVKPFVNTIYKVPHILIEWG
jgi:hypothetical protein